MTKRGSTSPLPGLFSKAGNIAAIVALLAVLYVFFGDKGGRPKPETASRPGAGVERAGDAEDFYKEGLGLLGGVNGASPDPAGAVTAFRAAAAKGHVKAMCRLGAIYEVGAGVSLDVHEAARFYTEAAELGDPEACVALGRYSFTGLGCDRDPAAAVRWYEKAAAKNYPPALNGLAFLYYNGTGVPADDAKAFALYSKAAGLGDAEAKFNVGAMYAKGRGVPVDFVKAEKFSREAADAGVPGAQFTLALLYKNGGGVPADKIEACARFVVANSRGVTAAAQFLKEAEGGLTPEEINRVKVRAIAIVEALPKGT